MNQFLQKAGVGLGLLVMPFISAAQAPALDADGDMTDFLVSIIDFVNDTAIPFLLGIGFLFFVWGMFKYFIVGGANEDSRNEGKNVIIYSVLGFTLIFIFWGVVQLVVSTTGLRTPSIPPELLPTLPGTAQP
jgi:hypothetical protein